MHWLSHATQWKQGDGCVVLALIAKDCVLTLCCQTYGTSGFTINKGLALPTLTTVHYEHSSYLFLSLESRQQYNAACISGGLEMPSLSTHLDPLQPASDGLKEAGAEKTYLWRKMCETRLL